MATKQKRPRKKITVPKNCFFCAEKSTPRYTEVAVLQRFISDRGKIITRTRSGLCAKHQRRLTSAVKYARHLALLPFVAHE